MTTVRPPHDSRCRTLLHDRSPVRSSCTMIVIVLVILAVDAHSERESESAELTRRVELPGSRIRELSAEISESRNSGESSSSGEDASQMRMRRKREAGCRGYLQDCSIQIAYPCCTGLQCVSKRCEWSPSYEARVASARQRTDSIAYPWSGQYKYGMRFQPIVPVFPEI